jgi:AraC family transcriptional regulator
MNEPKIINSKERKIAGYKLVTRNVQGENNKDIPNFWDKLMKEGKLEMIPDSLNPNTTYGVCIDSEGDNPDFTYIVGMEVSCFDNIFDDMVSITLPETSYAVFNVDVKDGISENLHKTYDYILNEWLPKSEYKFNGSMDFELYDQRFLNREAPVIDLYIPIEKK